MSYNRRKFLKSTGLLASGLLAGSQAVKAITAWDKEEEYLHLNNIARLKQFGLQLYSLRDDMPKDPQGVLRQVAGFGYTQVESFEGAKGMFWGLSNTDFKKFMDDLGMTIISSHCNINNNFEKKAAEAGEIGMKHLICPWVGPQKTMDDFKKIAEQFNRCGEICKKNGLRFGYHNHDYSFKPLEGALPQDVMMKNTDADIVDFQMDIYWVVTPGADPIEWFNKYPNRFRSVHVKDRIKGSNEEEASCDLGKGSIDFKKVLTTATKQGVLYYVVEQERYDNSTPLKSAQTDAAYMKKMKL